MSKTKTEEKIFLRKTSRVKYEKLEGNFQEN